MRDIQILGKCQTKCVDASQHLIYGKLDQVTLNPGDGKVRRIPESENYHPESF